MIIPIFASVDTIFLYDFLPILLKLSYPWDSSKLFTCFSPSLCLSSAFRKAFHLHWSSTTSNSLYFSLCSLEYFFFTIFYISLTLWHLFPWFLWSLPWDLLIYPLYPRYFFFLYFYLSFPLPSTPIFLIPSLISLWVLSVRDGPRRMALCGWGRTEQESETDGGKPLSPKEKN